MLKKIIKKGEKLPMFYGIAYKSTLYNKAVCYPIPLNLIMKFWKSIKTPKDSWWEKREKDIKAKIFAKVDEKITKLEFENLGLEQQVKYLNASLSALMQHAYSDTDIDDVKTN